MGGFIGLRLAARRSDIVKSAVILGSSADAEVSAGEMDAVVEVMLKHGIEPVLEDILFFMLGYHPERSIPLEHKTTCDLKCLKHELRIMLTRFGISLIERPFPMNYQK